MIVRLSYCFIKIGFCQGQMISWGKLAAMKKKKNTNKDRRLSWGWAKGGGGWGANQRNSFWPQILTSFLFSNTNRYAKMGSFIPIISILCGAVAFCKGTKGRNARQNAVTGRRWKSKISRIEIYFILILL